MISEFAIDPSVFTSWDQFRYFTDNFGVCHGRLISKYPAKWKKMVYETTKNCSEIERKRIEEKLAAIKEDKLIPSCRNWDNSKNDWLKNAEDAHSKKPFDAIVSESNPRDHEDVLVASEINDDMARWKLCRSLVIPCNPDELVKVVGKLLSISTEVYIIDPYFSPYSEESKKYFKRIIDYSLIRRTSKDLKKIAFICDIDNKANTERFWQQCSQALLPLIPNPLPSSTLVHISRFRNLIGCDKQHNRFILTDKGGFSLGRGIKIIKKGLTDDIILLDHEHYEKRWDAYCSSNPGFDVLEERVMSRNNIRTIK